jgi:hypothetical protein
MNTKMKKELINDVLTGLMVAATFSAIVPGDVLAANLAAVGTSAQASIMAPFVKFVGYIAYALGTILTVAGIAGAKKHADNPAQNPLAPVLGRLGAGAAFLSAPTIANMLVGTGTNVGLSGTTAVSTFGT